MWGYKAIEGSDERTQKTNPPPPNRIGTPEFNKWLTLFKHCVGSQGLDQELHSPRPDAAVC